MRFPIFKNHNISATGFTLVELIAVMVIVGILAVFAMPRLANLQSIDVRASADEVAAAVRYAQKLAIAQQRQIFVNLNAASGQICLDYVGATGGCAAGVNAVPSPYSGGRYQAPAKAGSVVLASNPAPFFFNALGAPFNALGAPSAGATLTVTGGGLIRTITVAPETGYVQTQ